VFIFDPLYLIIVGPAILLSLWAQIKVSSTFGKYSKVNAGLSGAEIARRLLDARNLSNIEIQMSRGTLSDHYDPRQKVLRLSPEVYQGKSLASLGVAAHEVGHAIQHAQSYFPLKLRSGLVPIAMFGSNLGPILIILGIFFLAGAASPIGSLLINLGILAFAGAVLFQVITLPVELNASHRALSLLKESGFAAPTHQKAFKSVLSAAALTYLAAALAAILQLLYFLMLRGRD
jgi:hypothetical protein